MVKVPLQNFETLIVNHAHLRDAYASIAQWDTASQCLLISTNAPLKAQKALFESLKTAQALFFISEGNWTVSGMTCAACVNSVKQIALKLPGVLSASVDLLTQTLNVRYVAAWVTPEMLALTLKKADYELHLGDQTNTATFWQQQLNEMQKAKQHFILAFIITAPLWLGDHVLGWNGFLYTAYQFTAATIVLGFAGRHYFVSAWRKLLQKTTNMDSLIALSTGVAWLYSTYVLIFKFNSHHQHLYFETAAGIIVFIALGKWIESAAKWNTTAYLRKLLKVNTASVLRKEKDGNWCPVAVKAITAGDILRIKAGETIPVDGWLLSSIAEVSEQMRTGESLPVIKHQKDTLWAGAVNTQQTLDMQAALAYNQSSIANIAKTIQNAQSEENAIQMRVNTIAAWFVPLIVLIAACTFGYWYINAPELALNFSISVLVIACPCALGLATPTAISAIVGKAANNGILIKSPEQLSALHQTDTVVFDKTGTLTQGAFSVVFTHWMNENDEIKKYFYVIQQANHHPIAAAFQNTNVNAITLDIINYPGQGVSAIIENETYSIGALEWILEKIKYDISAVERLIAPYTNHNWTWIAYSNSTSVLAIFAVSDRLKLSALAVVKYLKSQHKSVCLLSGDNAAAVRLTAEQLSISQWKAQCTPQVKKAWIAQHQNQGKKVLMIGDGINDCDAMQASNVAIAMGNGSGLALLSAGITLIEGKLEQVPLLFKIAKNGLKILHQNLFWAFLYNVLAIPIAAGVFYKSHHWMLDPAVAGASMAASSIFVVLNSLRIKLIN